MSPRYRKQYDLECALASVTREDLRVIRHWEFSLIDLEDQDFDREPHLRASLVIDLDGHDDFGSESRVHRPRQTARQVD